MASKSGTDAFLSDRGLIAFRTSSSIASSSKENVVSTQRIRAMKASLMVDSRLRKFSKCSAHLSKIALFSVRSWEPSLFSSVKLQMKQVKRLTSNHKRNGGYEYQQASE